MDLSEDSSEVLYKKKAPVLNKGPELILRKLPFNLIRIFRPWRPAMYCTLKRPQSLILLRQERV